VQMEIKKGTQITDDTIASIRTKGVIGDKFIKLSPGGSDEILGDNDSLMETESSISLEELVSKYVFEK
ncbi:MAG: outer membrane lipid asymmetry maintenance protein MlaD, partial [Proteobacteria bacterium]|nr:outer membrane lipid asymmetry maintenance protein MlaD [Pseudomonadota bacterium]